MNPLNLSILNEHSPYRIFLDMANSYSFVTDYGVSYQIHFMPDYSIWESGAYQFIIANANNKKSPNDKKLKETVFSVIESFFTANPSILLYICETGDGKEIMRNRLFLRWLREYDQRESFYIAHVEMEAEGINNFATMIVQRNNPRFTEIEQEFREAINELRKPGCDNPIEVL